MFQGFPRLPASSRPYQRRYATDMPEMVPDNDGCCQPVPGHPSEHGAHIEAVWSRPMRGIIAAAMSVVYRCPCTAVREPLEWWIRSVTPAVPSSQLAVSSYLPFIYSRWLLCPLLGMPGPADKIPALTGSGRGSAAMRGAVFRSGRGG